MGTPSRQAGRSRRGRPDDSFYQQVYRLARLIPRGQVATYGQIAWLLGVPRGARAVGWALRAVPGGAGVPWQRVVNAAGRVSEGRSRSEVVLQRFLLEQEGVVFDENDRIDLEIYGWERPA